MTEEEEDLDGEMNKRDEMMEEREEKEWKIIKVEKWYQAGNMVEPKIFSRGERRTSLRWSDSYKGL